MTLVVEDGTGVLTADAYVSTVACGVYAANRGLQFGTDAAADVAIRRATSYIDNTYRLRFPGYRTFRRAQALEWPRTGATYTYPEQSGASPYVVPYAFYPFDLIGINTVPPEIVTATCEAAIREWASPGVLLPDLERGGGATMVKAGSVEVKYAPGADPNTVFQAIEAALSGLIGQRSSYCARAARR